MSSDLYDVHVPTKLTAQEVDRFSAALSDSKLADGYMMRQILSRSPISIKKNIPRSEASKYERVANSCGISVTVKAAYTPSATPRPSVQPRCPKCGSASIQLMRKGFSFGKALVGAAAFGPVGAVAGLASDKYQRVCVNCGHKF